MALFKKLEPLGEEYYELVMTPASDKQTIGAFKRLHWGLLYVCLLHCALFISVAVDHKENPTYLHIISYALLALTLLFGIVLLCVTPGKTLLRHFRLRILMQFSSMMLVRLIIWNDALALMLAWNKGAIQYLILASLILIITICFDIWILFRARHQILKGALKKDGDGLLGIRNRPASKKIRPILVIVAPAITSLSTGLLLWAYARRNLDSFMAKLSGTTAYVPMSSFEASVLNPIIISSLAFFVLISCSAFVYHTFLWLHLYRKFGYQKPILERSPKKEKRQRRIS